MSDKGSAEERLINAARDGRADEVARLLNEGADPNLRFEGAYDHGRFLDEVTLLMAAAGSPRSNAATVQALLQGGADPFAVASGEVTALWFAAGGGTGYRLTGKNAASLELGHPFWNWGGGDLDRLRLLLDAGLPAEEWASNGRIAVSEACSLGDPQRVELLLAKGGSAWPRDGAETFAVPLFEAAASGSRECVQLILEQGFPADFRCKGRTALEFATTSEVAELLTQHGLKPERGRFRDAIDRAIGDDNFAVAEFLLAGLDGAERQRTLNMKLVRFAGVAMSPKAVRFLLDLGADVNYVEKGLGSPLSYACWQGDGNMGRPNEDVKETVEMLLAAGADPNKPGKGMSTPLHEAVEGDWGSPTSVRALLQHGALVDPVDEDGATPLILAASGGEVECVRLLLAAGADRKKRDKRGRSALDVARKNLESYRSPVAKWMGKVASKPIEKLCSLPAGSLDEADARMMEHAAETIHLLES